MKRRYWFVRKTYGYGWTPATWEGWLCIAAFIVALAAASLLLGNSPSPRDSALFTFLVLMFTAVLIAISYAFGEKPRWQWGNHKRKSRQH